MISANFKQNKYGTVADERKDAFSYPENTGFGYAGRSLQFTGFMRRTSNCSGTSEDAKGRHDR
jgi:hypothetical protein